MSADLEKLPRKELLAEIRHLAAEQQQYEAEIVSLKKALEQVRSERMTWPSEEAKKRRLELASLNGGENAVVVGYALQTYDAWLRSQVKPAPLPDRLSDEELDEAAEIGCRGDTEYGIESGFKKGYRACEKRYRGEG